MKSQMISMHRLLRLSPVSLFAASIFVACSSPPPSVHEQTAPLRILHWNDFHAHNVPYDVAVTDSVSGKKETYKVGGSGNLLGYLHQYGKGKDNVAVLNAGDDFQGTPISSMTLGGSQIELMNITLPDAMVLGNHEFDYGQVSLRAQVALAQYPLLAANLYDSVNHTTFAPPTMVKQFDRTRVGVIGLLPPDLGILTMKSNLSGLCILNTDSVVAFHSQSLHQNDRIDLLIVLSHMGFDQDTLLAARHEDVDVIVGGHSHLPLFTPLRKNRAIIVQAGSWGRWLGKLDLVVDLEGDSVRSYSGELVETRLGVYPVDSVAGTKALSLESQVDVELSEIVGTLITDWKRSFRSESNIGNWMADAMRAFAKTDIGLVNSGAIRKDLNAGPITRRDIWEIAPFGNTLVTFTFPGDSLLRMIEWQTQRAGELLQVSGLTYVFDSAQPSGRRIVSATVKGKSLDARATYSIVTNNYVGGHAGEFLGVQPSSIVQMDLRTLDRDVLIEAILRDPAVESKIEGRIVNLTPSTPEENNQ